jgi:hypothetical protein
MEQQRGTLSVPRDATHAADMSKFRYANFLREFLARCTRRKMPGRGAGHGSAIKI